MPQANFEMHEIHSDLDEENSPSTCPVDVFTSMNSSAIFDSSFSQYSFFKIRLAQIIYSTTIMPSGLADVPISIPPSTSPILSNSSGIHTTPTSPHSFIPQVETPLIPTISSHEFSTPIHTHISSPLLPIISTPSTIIPPVHMETQLLKPTNLNL